MSLTIYTKPNCPNCVMLKELLLSRSVAFSTIELNFGQTTVNPLMEVIDFKTKFPGVTTMPFFEFVKPDGSVETGGYMKAMNLFK